VAGAVIRPSVQLLAIVAQRAHLQWMPHVIAPRTLRLIRFLLDYQRVIDIARHGAARFWHTAWTAGTTKDQAGTGRCSELLGMIRVLLAAPQVYVTGPWQPGSHFLVRRSSA
jgi:hypothetical protein